MATANHALPAAPASSIAMDGRTGNDTERLTATRGSVPTRTP